MSILAYLLFQNSTKKSLPHYNTTAAANHTPTAADWCDTQPSPQARKYCTTGPNTGPGLPHPTGHEPTQYVHYIVIDKQNNTCYMHDSLPSAHTPTDFVKNEIAFPLTYTSTNNCSVLHHIYIASLINCIQPDDGHSRIGRNM